MELPASTPPSSLADHLALWLDSRLIVPCPDGAAGDLDSSLDVVDDVARLYGLCINDALGVAHGVDGAARFVWVGDGAPYELIESMGPLAVELHDALALVMFGWAAPTDHAGRLSSRPSLHPRRRRIRIVATLVESAVGTAIRSLDDGAVHQWGTTGGGIPGALRALAVGRRATVTG
jgi:hypothetical protein